MSEWIKIAMLQSPDRDKVLAPTIDWATLLIFDEFQ